MTTVKLATLETDDLIFRDASIEDINDAWPECFCKAESIKLVVKLDQVGFEDREASQPSFAQPNDILHSPFSLHNGGSAFKGLQVVLQSNRDTERCTWTAITAVSVALAALRWKTALWIQRCAKWHRGLRLWTVAYSGGGNQCSPYVSQTNAQR